MLDFKETPLCLIIKFTLFLISVVSMHNKNFALSLFKIIWFLKIKKLLDRKYNFGVLLILLRHFCARYQIFIFQ